ncbi:tyrosine-type recombinase/integrase [Dysgonomonas hofstadii]|uniref:tyrosine-type recombinase/integrase n=1 Tax=Dysgonomonas hofstadii TaxID=637886 RepID=UPI0016116145
MYPNESDYKQSGINEIIQVVQAGKPIKDEKYKFISSHTARRSFATNLYEATKDLVLVCRYMGHSNVKQTQRYLCASGDHYIAAKAYLNQFNI